MAWDAYLTSFHAGRPGITEAILRRSRDDPGDPYRWLADAVPTRGRVLDLGCGSGPLFRGLPERQYAGLDASDAELAAARRASAGPLLQARASAIPLRDASVDAVACSMSLMVTTPLPQVLAEISRVLRPGGVLAAIVPAAGPLRAGDRIITAGLVAALGRVPGYPAAPAPHRLAGAGMRVAVDEQRRFGYRMCSHADADRLLASLYLPGLPPRRYRLARAWLRFFAAFHLEFPVPLRRIIAERRELWRGAGHPVCSFLRPSAGGAPPVFQGGAGGGWSPAGTGRGPIYQPRGRRAGSPVAREGPGQVLVGRWIR